MALIAGVLLIFGGIATPGFPGGVMIGCGVIFLLINLD
jgi:hypothetical protein